MKKLKFVCFSLITLFLVLLSIVFGGVDTSAYSYNPVKDGEDFSPYLNKIVYCDLTQQDGQFKEDGSYGVFLYIDVIDGIYVSTTFQFNEQTDFHPVILSTIFYDRDWSFEGFYNLLGTDSLYWNPWAQYWQIEYPVEPIYEEDDWGAPESAKNFVDKDGRGIRFAIMFLHADVNGDFIAASMRAVKGYRFVDGNLDAGVEYEFGKNFFTLSLIQGYIRESMIRWGEGQPIPDYNRAYVYFDVRLQKFVLEYHGAHYAGYMLDKYLSTNTDAYDVGYMLGFDEGWDAGYFSGYDDGREDGYDDGYILGFYEGYDEGLLVPESEAYERGFADGQKSKLAENNQAFYQGIEKWLVPAIIAVIALGGFVTIAVNKRRGE